MPDTPEVPAHYRAGRARATTASTDATDTTITPNVKEQDLGLDLGGSFSKMFLGSDRRNSAMALRDENGRQVLQPSAMTGGRINAPSPIHVDRSIHVEPPPHSWASHRSNEDLLGANENTPPPVPKHDPPQIRPRGPNAAASDSLLKRTSAMFGGRRKSTLALEAQGEGDDLDSSLLAVSRFMSSDANSRSTTPVEAIGGRERNPNNAAAGYTIVPRKSPPTKDDSEEDDNMFDNIPLNSDRLVTPRQPQRKAPEVPAQAKVMTPLEFEKYRKDKEVASRRAQVDRIRDNVVDDEEEEDDDNYDDDEDEVEKSRQLAKQRRKQEAHMSVYRQQMMKVTGDNEPRPSFGQSYSSPNLTVPDFSRNTSSTTSDAEDDEEVPLAILAAHGFPNKNRPPTRLNHMSSNPNLRQATQPSFQRPGSAAGPMPSGGALPPFARNLPTDPYGLVNPTVRESFHLGGGMPAGSAAGQNPPTPAGPPTSHVGLVGVIASEEQQRRLRRGSPQVQSGEGFSAGLAGFDPNHGFPQQMMYPQAMQAQMQQMQQMQMQTQQTMMTPGEQAQIQLSQQMSQFMQMQMQLMQMMAGQQSVGLEPPRSAGHLQSQSLGGGNAGMGMNPGGRSSFLDPQMMETRGDGRTMSLVQPSSSSWLQPPPALGTGYAGSIRGGQGYAPSIAPSERSNVGLPGRYRPVSHMPPPAATTPDQTRKSFMTSPLSGSLTPRAADNTVRLVSTKDDADDDDDEGWAAMKAKREQKKSSWRVRKTLAPNDLDIGSLIT